MSGTSAPADQRRRELLSAYIEGGDESVRNELVGEFMPLVRALARRYAGRSEQLEDLVQVGCVGLVKALDRFDPERGSFPSYAVPTIVGEIKRHFRDRTWTVSVPRRIKDLSLAVSKQLDVLSTELGRSPSVAELAEAIGADEEEVLEALEVTRAQAMRPLTPPASEDGSPDQTGMLGTSDGGYEIVEDRAMLADGLRALDERERRIVELRFFGELSQSEIARDVGISQMHVSRLLRVALEKMRESIELGPEP